MTRFAPDLLGAHVSTAGGVDRAPENARALRCSAMQIFTRNQRQWEARPLSREVTENFRNQVATCGIAATVAHASYLLNLAGRGEVVKRSRTTLLDEWDRCEALGLLGLCFHPGAHLGLGEEKGLDRVIKNLNRVDARRPTHKSLLLVENTAGQGTNVGWRLEHLAAILDGLERPERFGLCIDTCHLFAAGYDLRRKDLYSRTFRELDRVVGLKRVRVFHLNDSKSDLGSRIDRHAPIGRGKIGREAFRLLLRDKRFRKIPKILETPGGEANYQRELRLLRRLKGQRRLPAVDSCRKLR